MTGGLFPSWPNASHLLLSWNAPPITHLDDVLLDLSGVRVRVTPGVPQDRLSLSCPPQTRASGSPAGFSTLHLQDWHASCLRQTCGL